MNKFIYLSLLATPLLTIAAPQDDRQGDTGKAGIDWQAQAQMPEFIQHDFKTLDKDDNGQITLAEAEGKNLERHFGYVDDDRDYLISRAEFRAYTESDQQDN